MKENNQETRCHLSVILARESRIGIVLCRTSNCWVQLIKWDTATDAFETGQWFHGHIYDRYSDLSPDGTKFIYFAVKYYWKTIQDTEVGPSWTAISKPPYWTALALWSSRSYWAWQGGSFFATNEEVWLDGCVAEDANLAIPTKGHLPDRLKVTVTEDSILPSRQKQNGWQDGSKPHPTQPLTLSKVPSSEVAKCCNFTIRNMEHDFERLLFGVTWADWDKQGRLVYAKDGKLFEGGLSPSGEFVSREIADFNANTPEIIAAPEWAKAW